MTVLQAVSKMLGGFVHDCRLGPAKVIEIQGGRYKLEYFYSPRNRKIGWVASETAESIRLPLQTRIYVEENGWWRVGRVRAVHPRTDKGCDYTVEFPNNQRNRYSEQDVYCRCWAPHDDPTVGLAVGGGDTLVWHERRHSFLAMVLEQRAACRGLASLLSSRIELVPHQVEVARRVLEDPLQRYLLADEVGMGKTIEAGIIIRQYLLGSPKGGPVWIIVPERLLKQWQRELVSKFSTNEFPQRVRVLNVDQLRFPPGEEPGMVVIDEAHHVVSGIAPPGLLEVASWAPRLLLLSATPALGQPEVLLRLLRIIDPDNYDAVTLESFQTQIDKREAIGIFLRGLRGEASPAVLRQRLRNVPTLFPSDEVAVRMALDIAEAMEQADVARTRQLTSAMRSHIADVHRIHQRLVRTRRRDAAAGVFRPRGPIPDTNGVANFDHVQLCTLADSRLAAVADLLEQWRIESASADDCGGVQRIQSEQWAACLFEALGGGVDRMKMALQQVPDALLSQEWRRGFASLFCAENTAAPRADQVAHALQCYLELLRSRLHVECPKIVVFGSDDGDLACCAQATESLLGKARVMLSCGIGEDTDISMAFYDRNEVQVLLCGRLEEEGLNLHFADAIVHLDLPLSPTRIEQRIGRVDRFGRRVSFVPQCILLPDFPESASVWLAWYEILASGFQIFNSPVTDVQFLLESINSELSAALFESGADGLRDRIGAVRTRLGDERERLDNQHALDRVLQEEFSGQLLQRLQKLEADEDKIISATRGWLLDALSFECKGELQEICRIGWNSENTLLPAWPWEQIFKLNLEAKHTFRRNLVLRPRMGPQPELVRLGSSLMRALEQQLRWDDRGTAFATWRHVPSEFAGEWIGFKLCYTVEASLPSDLRPDERSAMAARADGYLAPWLETLYVDAQLQIVTDPALLKTLQIPYQQGRDTDIGGGPEVIDALFGMGNFDQLCGKVRGYSESWLRATEGYGRIVAGAVDRGTADIQRRLARLALRQAVHCRQAEGGNNGIEREIALDEALMKALSHPLVKLDAIGLYVISHRSPHAYLSEI